MEKNDLEKRRRTLTRLVAAQVIYQFDFFEKKHKIEEIQEDLLQNYILFEDEEPQDYRGKIELKMLNELISGALEGQESLESDILDLQNKKQDIDDLLLKILILSAFELKFLQNNPVKVIIDEYTTIVSFFFDDSKVNFSNSIIENLAKKYERK
jgi:transcription termination factor NusB